MGVYLVAFCFAQVTGQSIGEFGYCACQLGHQLCYCIPCSEDVDGRREEQANDGPYEAANESPQHAQEGVVAGGSSQYEYECCTDGNLRGKILTAVLKKHADDLGEEDHERNRPDVETEKVRYKYCQAHADDHAKDTFDTLAHRLPTGDLDNNDCRYHGKRCRLFSEQRKDDFPRESCCECAFDRKHEQRRS